MHGLPNLTIFYWLDMLVYEYILLVDGRWALKYVGGIRKLYLFM